MLNIKYLYLFVSLFFLLTFSNAYAYYPYETYSTGSNIVNMRGLACSNITGTFYCYMFGSRSDSHLIVERYNETFGNKVWCDIGLTGVSGVNAFGIANSTHVVFSQTDNKIRLIPINNISSSTSCGATGAYSNGTFSSNFGCAGFYNLGSNATGWNYWSANGGIRNSTSNENISSSFWDTQVECLRLPDQTDNSTMFGVNYTHTYDGFLFWKYINGEFWDYYPNWETVFNISYTGSTFPYFDLFKVNSNLTWLYGPGWRANFSYIDIYYSYCNATSEDIIGTRCTNSLDNREYLTSDGCINKYASCPTGSICSQLTPQINVSSDLVENYTSCQIVTNGGLRMNCFNICFKGTVVFSNCVEDGCKQCPDLNGGITYNSIYGFYTNTWYTNQSTVSVPSYTIACINTTTGYATTIIDNLGNVTSETELLTKAGNNISAVPFTGEQPPGNSITSLGTWINQQAGSVYGSELIAFIVAFAVSCAILFKVEDKKIETFAIPFIFILAGFSLPGVEFFPSWIWLLLTVMTGVLIFWKAKGG